jgi:hypothetical protein
MNEHNPDPFGGSLRCQLRTHALLGIYPAGRDEPRIEVTGRLAKLTGDELFPQSSLTTAVAGAGIEPATYGL